MDGRYTTDRTVPQVLYGRMVAACAAGQLRVVRALLDESQPYACRPDGHDSEYLVIAAECGHVDVVRELLNPAHQHCAKANARNSYALNVAAQGGHVNVLLELLDTSRKHHAKANDNNCESLEIAASNGHVHCVRALLDTSRGSCAPGNARNSQLLFKAAENGHRRVVRELLDPSRPNHDTADAHGSGALWFAAKNGRSGVLRELLWRKDNPADCRSLSGNMALEMAVRNNDLECCRLLLEYPGLPPREIESSVLAMAANSNNAELSALVKEVNRWYQAKPAHLNMAWYILVRVTWFNLVLNLVLAWPQNRALKTWCIFCGASAMLVYLACVIYTVLAPSRRKAAVKQAAVVNEAYRAAWYKAKEQ